MSSRAFRTTVIIASLTLGGAAFFAACSTDDDNGDTSSSTSSGVTGGSGGSTSSGGGTGGIITSSGGGVGGSTSSGGGVGGSSTSTSSSGLGGAPTIEVPCLNQIYDCGDIIDNDGDGLIDWQDPDCLGPCDNTEDSFYPDLPGDTGAACDMDCFWDNGNGSGNDDCYWNHQCDPLEVAPDYPPEGIACEYDNTTQPKPGMSCTDAMAEGGQSQICYDVCGPLVPNGCDCFGCCHYPGVPYTIWLGSYDSDKNGTCTINVVNDPALCQPCTFVPGCSNDCGICELCLGKTPADLPPECFNPPTGGSGGSSSSGVGGSGTGGAPPTQCPPGIVPCGMPGQPQCAAGFYCITGCCRAVPA